MEILELLNDINLRGTTVLFATHARDLVDRFKRRTLVLRTASSCATTSAAATRSSDWSRGDQDPRVA